jgi:hypothetical protein
VPLAPSADNVFERVVAEQLFLQLFDLAQVLKGLHPAGHVSIFIQQDGCRNANRYPFPLMIDDKGRGIDDGTAAFKSPLEGTVIFADIGVKDVPASTAQGLAAPHTCDLFRCLVKRSDAPLSVNSKYPFVDRIEDHILRLVHVDRLHLRPRIRLDKIVQYDSNRR